MSDATVIKDGVLSAITPCIDDSGYSTNFVNTIDLSKMELICKGDGQTINQTGGKLVITAGKTANEETILRTRASYKDVINANILFQRSAAIANNRVMIHLLDVIGDNLLISVDSATSATITIPNTNKYYKRFKDILTTTATGLVAHNMTIGALVAGGVVGAIPSRYPIASAVYDDAGVYLNFTVSGWTGGSSGTCTLYGWNFIGLYMSGTSAYSVNFDCARYGRSSSIGYAAVGSSAQLNTSNILYTLDREELSCGLGINLLTSNAAKTYSAGREESMPDMEEELYLQFNVRNESSAPAADTTMNFLGFRVRQTQPVPVSIEAVNALRNYSGSPALATYNAGGSTAVTGSLTSAGYLTGLSLSVASTGFSGALTAHKLASAATTNFTLVKTSRTCLNGGTVKNVGESDTVYFKMYNKATAPTSSDVPIFTIPVKAGETISLRDLSGVVGHYFALGMCYGITANAVDNDNTAIAANAVYVNISYT